MLEKSINSINLAKTSFYDKYRRKEYRKSTINSKKLIKRCFNFW